MPKGIFSEDDIAQQSKGQEAVEQTRTELLQRFEYAQNCRKEYEDVALRCYKNYMAFREPKKGTEENRSNLFIPRTYEELDVLRARILKALFTTRPYIEFTPKPTMGEVEPPDQAVIQQVVAEGMSRAQEQGKAITPEELLQAIMDHHLQMSIDKMDANAKLAGALADEQLAACVEEMYTFVTNFLIFPVSVASVGWEYRTKKVKQTVYDDQGAPKTEEREVVVKDDNVIRAIDFWDFWWDGRGKDLDTCRFVWHRDWMTLPQLQDYLAKESEMPEVKVHKPENWDDLAKAGENLQDGREERQSAVGKGLFGPDTFTKTAKNGELFEILHYWEDDRHAIIVNREHLALDGPNHYERHSLKPFIRAVFEPDPGMFAGISAAEWIENQQAELNTSRNQRIDNISMILNRMWIAKKGMVEPSDLVSRPFGVIWVNDVTDVKPADYSEIPQSSFISDRELKEDMENTLGVSGAVRGTNSIKQQTATETLTQSQGAELRFDVKSLLYQSQFMNRLAYMLDCNNQQFITDVRVLQMYGEQGVSWKQIDPVKIIGEHQYSPTGSASLAAASRDVYRMQMTNLVTTLKDHPFVDQYELIKAYIGAFEQRNVDRFLKSKNEVMAMQQAAQQQAAMEAAAAQAGGQGAQPGGMPQASQPTDVTAQLATGGPI